ncbi:MAG: AraC family transcriptional regulator [Betaproteobacteria bacterium]
MSDYMDLWRVPQLGIDAFAARVERFSYGRHGHDSYALGTVDAGAMRFWHGGASHVAAPGSLFAINPGEVTTASRPRAQDAAAARDARAHRARLGAAARAAVALRRAGEYLAEHLSGAVTLAELAAAVGLSPFYLLRAFKRKTVAAELGFCDQSHLARRFKRAFGVTLAQYASRGL